MDLTRYFDHAATTPVRPEVIAAMAACWADHFGNPSSLHDFGLRAKEALERARAVIAGAIGASPRELIFTGSGTEANNLAVLGGARRMRLLGKGDHVVVSAVEHPSVREAARALEAEGFRVTWVPVDAYARVDPDDVRRALTPKTVLVSVMHANNVVGTIQPIAAIAAAVRRTSALFHCDAAQSFGKIPVNVNALGVDLLTVNAHKLGGPKGVAALYVRKGVRIDPLVYGGKQERALRPATQNVPGIVGFAKAVELALAEQETERRRLAALRQRLIARLATAIPGFHVNGHPTECLPTHLNIRIDRIEGQALMLELDRRGFATSSGSACSAANHEPSYVLLAMGQSREAAWESLRITLGRTTTEASVDALADALIAVAHAWQQAANIPFAGGRP